MELFSMTVGLGLSIGVGLLVHAGLSTFGSLLRRVWQRGNRSRLAWLGLEPSTQPQNLPGFQTGRIPWKYLYILAGMLGVVIWLILPSNRWIGPCLPLLVWGIQRTSQQQQKRFLLTQIRAFFLDVRLHMSLSGSLLLGLQRIGQTNRVSSPLYRSLQYRLKGASTRTGLDLLKQIGQDLGSDEFTRIVQRIQAASQSGGISDMDKALERAIADLNEEISYQTEEQMQRLPTRITLLAMPFLLGLIVILLFYPLVDRILQTLSGVGIGGGF